MKDGIESRHLRRNIVQARRRGVASSRSSDGPLRRTVAPQSSAAPGWRECTRPLTSRRSNPRGSTGSRNHIARRRTPASGSDGNGRAGRLPAPRAAPRPPPRRHWTAPRRRGIKGWQSCLRRRCAPRARGLTPIKLPGPSSICVSCLQHGRRRQNRTQGAGADTPASNRSGRSLPGLNGRSDCVAAARRRPQERRIEGEIRRR